jgi:hypothetical protein
MAVKKEERRNKVSKTSLGNRSRNEGTEFDACDDQCNKMACFASPGIDRRALKTMYNQ